MRLAKNFVFLGIFALSSGAFSQTVYKSNDFLTPCPTAAGKDCTYSFEVELAFKETKVGDKSIETIEGKFLNFYGVRSCQWRDMPIRGTVNPNGNVRWRSEGDIPGCTRIVFEGKKDGDNLVGAVPSFNKTRVDITLKPKK